MGPNPDDMTREKCAAMCGEIAAVNPGKKVYMAIEAADQCRCGVQAPDSVPWGQGGMQKVADSQCDMKCSGDHAHMCELC